MSQVPANGLYRHYGGGLYVVVGVVRDSTNGVDEGRLMVLYYSVAHHAFHVREVKQFTEPVSWDDGMYHPRFSLVPGDQANQPK